MSGTDISTPAARRVSVRWSQVLPLASIAWAMLVAAPATPARADDVAPWTLAPPVPAPGALGLAQDGAGYLWIGSAAGLDRWDGASLRHSFPDGPGIESSAVHAVMGTGSGDAWAALSGPCSAGLLRCDGQVPGSAGLMRVRDGRAETTAVIAGVGSVRALALAIWDDALWVGTADGLLRSERGTDDPRRLKHTPFRRVPLANGARAVLALLPSATGALFVAASDGVWAITPAGEATRVVDEPARALAERDGELWVATARGALGRTRAGLRRLTTSDGLPSDDVRALTVDGEGALWVGTWAGLARWDGARMSRIALLDPRVLTLAVDDERGVWIGARTGGALRASRRRARTFGAPEGLPSDQITSVLVAGDGTVWATALTRYVVHRASADRFETSSVQPIVGDVELGALAESSTGTLLLGTRGAGLLAREGGTWRRVAAAPPDVRALLVARDGRVHVGSADGSITVLEHAHAGARAVGRRGGCSGAITAIAEDAMGRVWATNDDDGVTILDHDDARCVSGVAGLPHARFGAVAASVDGTVWLGSPDGHLVRHRDGMFRSFDERDGLPCDAVAAIVPEGRDHVWYTCGAGAARVATAAFEARVHNGTPIAAVAFNRSTGMRAEESSRRAQPAAAIDARGTLWAATIGGLAALASPDVAPPEPAPRARITKLWLDDVEVPAEAAVTRARRAKLRASFAAMTLAGTGAAEFRRQLTGPDVDRDEASLDDTASFGALAPGRYVLRVSVRTAAGALGQPAIAHVQVLAPYFLQPQVWLAAVAALGAAGLAASRARTRRLAARQAAIQRERERIARDLHDDLGQGFTAIRFHAQALELALAQQGDDEARGLLERLRKLVGRVEDDARRSVWNLRSHTADAPALAPALRDLVGELERSPRGARPAKLRLELTEPVRGPDALATAELLHVAREALTNALRHADARTITVTLETDADELRLAVHDDGRGFDPGAVDPVAAGHFGLLGMRERLRRLGGTVTIDSSPGEGTTVLAVLPFTAR